MTTIAPDVIDALESWEELSDAARLVAADLDTGRFTLGDIACRVQTVYGADSIGKLAGEIGIAQKKMLWDYARVARRFEFSARTDYLDAGLTWSHFRTALRTGDDAELWLARAADNGWPVAELGRQIAGALGKPVPPKLVLEAAGIVLDCADGHVTLYIEAAHDLAYRQQVTVKVYEGGAA